MYDGGLKTDATRISISENLEVVSVVVVDDNAGEISMPSHQYKSRDLFLPAVDKVFPREDMVSQFSDWVTLVLSFESNESAVEQDHA